MTREREATLVRRTSSRSVRASLEGDPSRTSTDEEGANAAATAPVDTHSDLQGSTSTQHAGEPASPHQPDGNGFKERSSTGTTSTGGIVSSSAIEPTEKNDSDEAMPREAPAGESAGAAVVATPPGTGRRGRGRPRKKPAEAKGDEAGVPEAASTMPATAVAGVAESKKEGGKGGQTARNNINSANPDVGGASAGQGNESDEWSEDDDVHHLPAEVKAQFGNVRTSGGVYAVFSRCLACRSKQTSNVIYDVSQHAVIYVPLYSWYDMLYEYNDFKFRFTVS